jgi:hypothetical protein
LDLDDGGTVTYDNVVSCTIEESEPIDEDLPEEGDPDREGNEEVDMGEPTNPMDETEEQTSK